MNINFRNYNYPVNPAQSAENSPDNSNVENNTNLLPIPEQLMKAENFVFSGSLQLYNLSKTQRAFLFRELLNFPKDFKGLMALLEFKEPNLKDPDLVEKLFSDPQIKILISDIKNLLEQNPKDAVNKLIKLLQPNTRGLHGSDNIEEIISLIKQFIPSQNSKPQDVLKDVILLYLPGLPLTNPQNLKLELLEENSGENAQDNIAMIMYITTLNSGKFKVTISIKNDYALNINIEYENNENTNIQQIERMENDILTDLKNIHISAKLNILVNKQTNIKNGANKANEDVQKNKKFKSVPVQSANDINDAELQKKGVAYQPMSAISPKVLAAAHVITKVIFEIDEKISTLNQRKKMVSE